MKSQIFRRLVHLAAAILLFVIASQCPYSSYGPLAMDAIECFSSKQIENSIISTTSVIADLRQAPGPPPRGRRCFPRNSSTRSAPLLLHRHRYDTRSTTRSSPHTGSPRDTSFIPYRNYSDMVDAKSRTQPTIQVNRHRLRQNQHGPEIHFNWSTNPSPYLLALCHISA